jgi:hypothetical protein
VPQIRANSALTRDLILDVDAFERACERYGHVDPHGVVDDKAVAAAFGLNRLTVWRVRTDRLSPGPRFIGGALKAWRGMRFEDLFMIVDYVPRSGRNAVAPPRKSRVSA